VNLAPEDPWTGSLEALPSPTFVARQLPTALRRGLRDAYDSVLNESIPEGLARYLAEDRTRTAGAGRPASRIPESRSGLSASPPQLGEAGSVSNPASANSLKPPIL
jgi:hypothetical protein